MTCELHRSVVHQEEKEEEEESQDNSRMTNRARLETAELNPDRQENDLTEQEEEHLLH